MTSLMTYLDKLTYINELVVVSITHTLKGVVLSGEVTGQTLEGISHGLLDQATLSTADGWGEANSLHGAAGTDTARLDVLGVGDLALKLASIQIGSGVLLVGSESLMFVINDGIKDLLEYL